MCNCFQMNALWNCFQVNALWNCFQVNALWNCLQVSAKEHISSYVNIGSGNGLVPWGIKPLPEPMWTRLTVAILLDHRIAEWYKWNEVSLITTRVNNDRYIFSSCYYQMSYPLTMVYLIITCIHSCLFRFIVTHFHPTLITLINNVLSYMQLETHLSRIKIMLGLI